MTCARDIKNYLTLKVEGASFYGNKHILKYKTSSFKYQMHISEFYFQVHSLSPQKLLEHVLFAVKKKGAQLARVWIWSVWSMETAERAAWEWLVTRNLRHAETSPADLSGTLLLPRRMERGAWGALASTQYSLTKQRPSDCLILSRMCPQPHSLPTPKNGMK